MACVYQNMFVEQECSLRARHILEILCWLAKYHLSLGALLIDPETSALCQEAAGSHRMRMIALGWTSE
ncbi:hypothetical protein FOBRF1_005768 [Fusarium oxysporum]